MIPTEQMTILGDDLVTEFKVEIELTDFSTGGAMLDVRRDNRLFVMAYAPANGFGVDEVHDDDGFVASYKYTFSSFEPAAEQLRRLIEENLSENTNGVELNLVVIYSEKIHEAKRFYDCLGLSLEREQHGSGPEHYASEIGSMVFEIYTCSESANGGSTRIGFSVPSVDQTLDCLRLEYDDLKVLSEPKKSPWGRRAVVEDCDGNRVELTESDS